MTVPPASKGPRPPRTGASRKGQGERRPPARAAAPVEAERIAKALSRAGAASRREAEAMIAAGRVSVNGTLIDTPATLVRPGDLLAIDGVAVAEPGAARMWRYHKPRGVVVTARDEKGRTALPDVLPPDLPRVMPVGRLDIASEGLLLLTTDGALKRRLELPSTGWLRRYRVRVHGSPTEAQLDRLRAGIEVEGERFQPMEAMLDRQQGANAWVTVGLREGRNREVRRAMEAVGLIVNRLIRVSYGPFRLGDLAPGEVAEIRPRHLRDQLGEGALPAEAEEAPRGAGDPSVSLRKRPAATRRPSAARAPGRDAAPAETNPEAPPARPKGGARHNRSAAATDRPARPGPGPGPGPGTRARAATGDKSPAERRGGKPDGDRRARGGPAQGRSGAPRDEPSRERIARPMSGARSDRPPRRDERKPGERGGAPSPRGPQPSGERPSRAPRGGPSSDARRSPGPKGPAKGRGPGAGPPGGGAPRPPSPKGGRPPRGKR